MRDIQTYLGIVEMLYTYHQQKYLDLLYNSVAVCLTTKINSVS